MLVQPCAQDADGPVAQAGHDAGHVVCPNLRAILPEGDVADLMQRFYRPMAADAVG
jgi:hypothetical protein